MARPKKDQIGQKTDKFGNQLRPGESVIEVRGKTRYRARWKDQFTGKMHDISSSSLIDVREKRAQIEQESWERREMYRYHDAQHFRGRQITIPETLDDLFDIAINYRAVYAETDRKSRKAYNNHVRGTWLGRMHPRFIEKDTIKDFFRELRTTKELRKNTIQHLKYVISIAFNYAVEKHWLPVNPASHAMEVFRREEDEPTNKITLSPEQEYRLFAFLAKDNGYHKYADMIRLYLDLGCRFGEFAGLTWPDIHYDRMRPYVFLEHQVRYVKKADDEKSTYVVRRPKTKKGIRLIVFTEAGTQALYNLKKKYMLGPHPPFEVDGLHDFIFTTKTGKPQTSAGFNSILKDIVNAYNRDEIEQAEAEGRAPVIIPVFTCRTFRRTAATRGSEVLSEEELIDRMGHTDIETTRQYYIKHHYEEKLKAAQKLDQLAAEYSRKYAHLQEQLPDPEHIEADRRKA